MVPLAAWTTHGWKISHEFDPPEVPTTPHDFVDDGSFHDRGQVDVLRPGGDPSSKSAVLGPNNRRIRPPPTGVAVLRASAPFGESTTTRDYGQFAVLIRRRPSRV